ncbi:MAG: hypothetical protein D6712_11815 [Chloroflexi bacterium]|nr:MAG: hypothetical protein D6712_11815 [Chloroflexota bacterium]
MTINSTERPGRPLGVTLAIICSVIIFSFIPLVHVYFLLRIRHIMSFGPESVIGFNITGLSTANLLLEIGLAIAFLVIAIVTWRGRPAYMRHVFVGAVLLLGVIFTVVFVLPPLLQTPSLAETGLDSGQDAARQQAIDFLIATAIVSLYVVWYMNRGPARAFYRGYYLPDPDAEETK